jgi:hypothetical protein
VWIQRGQTERIVVVFIRTGFGVGSEQRAKCKVDGFARTVQVVPIDHLIDQGLIDLDSTLAILMVQHYSLGHVANCRTDW